MSSTADDHNPLLSTPVAKVAIDLFVDVLRSNVIAQGRVADAARANVDCAEAIISELQARGHLPGTLVKVEEPKADDATLLLQAMIFLGASWESYDGAGDPRGEIVVNGLRYTTKAVKGVPAIPPRLREDLVEALAPHLRKL